MARKDCIFSKTCYRVNGTAFDLPDFIDRIIPAYEAKNTQIHISYTFYTVKERGNRMGAILEEIYSDMEFMGIVGDLIKNETVLQMKEFRQHYGTTCFEHCLTASYYCYLICRKHGWDHISCARGAILHDLFLYDWRKRENGRKGFHAFTHPHTAYTNARRVTALNDKETDIILKHMWPVTISLPKYKESYVLTMVDKFCAISEAVEELSRRHAATRFLRHASLFLTAVMIKI